MEGVVGEATENLARKSGDGIGVVVESHCYVGARWIRG